MSPIALKQTNFNLRTMPGNTIDSDKIKKKLSYFAAQAKETQKDKPDISSIINKEFTTNNSKKSGCMQLAMMTVNEIDVTESNNPTDNQVTIGLPAGKNCQEMLKQIDHAIHACEYIERDGLKSQAGNNISAKDIRDFYTAQKVFLQNIKYHLEKNIAPFSLVQKESVTPLTISEDEFKNGFKSAGIWSKLCSWVKANPGTTSSASAAAATGTVAGLISANAISGGQAVMAIKSVVAAVTTKIGVSGALAAGIATGGLAVAAGVVAGGLVYLANRIVKHYQACKAVEYFQKRPEGGNQQSVGATENPRGAGVASSHQRSKESGIRASQRASSVYGLHDDNSSLSALLQADLGTHGDLTTRNLDGLPPEESNLNQNQGTLESDAGEIKNIWNQGIAQAGHPLNKYKEKFNFKESQHLEEVENQQLNELRFPYGGVAMNNYNYFEGLKNSYEKNPEVPVEWQEHFSITEREAYKSYLDGQHSKYDKVKDNVPKMEKHFGIKENTLRKVHFDNDGNKQAVYIGRKDNRWIFFMGKTTNNGNLTKYEGGEGSMKLSPLYDLATGKPLESNLALQIVKPNNANDYEKHLKIQQEIQNLDEGQEHTIHRQLTGVIEGDSLKGPSMKIATCKADGSLEALDASTLKLNLVSIFEQITAHVAWLKANSIYHGDIKPENFLFRKDGNNQIKVYISDFGTAKIGEDDTFLNKACNEDAGTLEYKPNSKSDNLTYAQRDLFATILTLYKLTALAYEYEDKELHETIFSTDVNPAISAADRISAVKKSLLQINIRDDDKEIRKKINKQIEAFLSPIGSNQN